MTTGSPQSCVKALTDTVNKILTCDTEPAKEAVHQLYLTGARTEEKASNRGNPAEAQTTVEGARDLLSLVALVVGLDYGCSKPDDRPAAAEWLRGWEQRQELIPDAATLLEGGRDLCDERVCSTIRT